ncbi:MAG: phasin family protein [Gammaproteobacteria bacterium]|nr:phasin family protein [Gammaproteobacteria bacterium]NNM00072.1 phasin family protein [Gammaproteobacteria bacterium]
MARKISAEEILESTLPDAEEVLRLQREAAEQFTGSTQEWSARITEINEEMMAFMRKRAESNQALLESMIGCRNAEELGRLHSDWMQGAISDYSAEMQRVMELYTNSLLLPLQAAGSATAKTAKATSGKSGTRPPAKKRPAA